MSAPTAPFTPTPTPKKRRAWPYIAVVVGTLIIGIGIGRGTAPATVTAAPAPPAATYSAPAYVPDNPAVPAPTYAPAPVYTPTGPLTSFGEGTYEVGTGDGQVAPGKYKSPGPGYWARLNADGGIIDNDLSDGQLLLTVKKGDAQIQISRSTFTKV